VSETLFEPPAIPKNTCPHCGALAGHKPAIKLGKSFSLTAFITGGIIGVVLLNAGRAKRVRCNACGGVFKTRTPASIISLLFFWLFIAPGLIVLTFFLLHELWSVIRG
jgi:hypothetical protein